MRASIKRGPGGGVQFNDVDRPVASDFAYLAFTIA
jgi:hypothetical protein